MLHYVICGQRRPRSDCANAQSDQGFRCPLVESVDTEEYIERQCILWLDCADQKVDHGMYLSHKSSDLRSYAPKEDTNQPAFAQSDQILLCSHEETLYPWLSKMRSGKSLITLCECAGWSESSLSVHIWRYVFSHVALYEVNVFNSSPAEPGYVLPLKNGVDRGQLASEEANWSGSALFLLSMWFYVEYPQRETTFSDFMFALLHIRPLLKMGPLLRK